MAQPWTRLLQVIDHLLTLAVQALRVIIWLCLGQSQHINILAASHMQKWACAQVCVQWHQHQDFVLLMGKGGSPSTGLWGPVRGASVVWLHINLCLTTKLSLMIKRPWLHLNANSSPWIQRQAETKTIQISGFFTTCHHGALTVPCTNRVGLYPYKQGFPYVHSYGLNHVRWVSNANILVPGINLALRFQFFPSWKEIHS